MGHGHTHPHNGHADKDVSDRRLWFSVILNVGLSAAEVVAGLLSGSLALVADALHNFSDAGALVVAALARKISRRKADAHFTFGYRRAELIGALINLTTLILVGLYLSYEAVERLLNPQPITAFWVMVAAGIALAVDVFTALFLWSMSKGSLNVRAAFIHNLTDAGASLAVLLGGLAIHLWDWILIDSILTLGIAAYVLIMSVSMLRQAARILMEGTPPDLDLHDVTTAMKAVESVEDVHHLHAWELDEHHRALEAHVVVALACSREAIDRVRIQLRELLDHDFEIGHATLEFEWTTTACEDGSGTHTCNHGPDEKADS